MIFKVQGVPILHYKNMKKHKYNLLHFESKVASFHPGINENLSIIS